MQLHLEDVAVGAEFISDEVTITAEDIVAFAQQFDPQPFHLDADAAHDTFFRGLAASGWHTAAITMRLLVTSGLNIAGGIIGAGGQLSWPTPTRAGDRLHVRAVVQSVSTSKTDPSRGSAILRIETLTSEGEVRQIFEVRILLFAR